MFRGIFSYFETSHNYDELMSIFIPLLKLFNFFFYLVILLGGYDEKLVAVDILRTINVYKENDCAKKNPRKKSKTKLCLSEYKF